MEVDLEVDREVAGDTGAVEDQHADRADAQHRVGRPDVRPDRHLAEREQPELLGARVEVDAQEEDAVDPDNGRELVVPELDVSPRAAPG